MTTLARYLDQLSVADDSDSTAIFTPAETMTDSHSTETAPIDPPLFVMEAPWPGSSYIITCATSGKAITLIDGNVRLRPMDGAGSVLWVCVEKDEWFGFKNPVSGKYLGYNEHGKLRCTEGHLKKWEYFATPTAPDGTVVLKQPRKDDSGLITVGAEVLPNGETGLRAPIAKEVTMRCHIFRVVDPRLCAKAAEELGTRW